MDRWFIHKPDPEGARYLEIKLWDDLLGAQISVVKQPYAYFNKELVRQIDASGVGLSTVFSPKMQRRHLEPPLSRGPPRHLEAASGESRGRTVWRDPPFPDCGLVHTGASVHLGILPRAGAKGALGRCGLQVPRPGRPALKSCFSFRKAGSSRWYLSSSQRFSRACGKTGISISKAVCHYSGLPC